MDHDSANSLPPSKQDITLIILAGGLGRRMRGRDKGLELFNGRPLIRHVLDALTPQVSTVLISANRNLEEYSQFGFPVIEDEYPDHRGPLAGCLAAMNKAATGYVLSTPCDTPLLPSDLVRRLATALASGASVAVPHDGERAQRSIILMPTALRSDIDSFLRAGERKVGAWLNRHQVVNVDFSDIPDAFVNLNTRDECSRLETHLAGS